MHGTAQRLALPAWGGRLNSPSKWDSAEATKKLKKRGAYPKSGARIVRRAFAHKILCLRTITIALTVSLPKPKEDQQRIQFEQLVVENPSGQAHPCS